MRYTVLFQIQGQLGITGKQFCDFVVYTENDFFVERIFPDKKLWEEEMVPKLNWFSTECLIPELADPRIPRNGLLRIPKTMYNPIPPSPGATSSWDVTNV